MSAPISVTVGRRTEKFPRSPPAAMIVAHATTAMPPASPFNPSMKLKTLVTPTIQRMTSGTLTHPSGTPMPYPSATASMLAPNAMATIAATSCAKNFTPGESPRMSSTRPVRKRIAEPMKAPARNLISASPSGPGVVKRGEVRTKRTHAMSAAQRNTATPPRRGIGFSWT
jgi:hypothetical protein